MRAIVCTTIQGPTDSIRMFDSFADWYLIVVGDLKTPKGYHLDNGFHFSPEA